MPINSTLARRIIRSAAVATTAIVAATTVAACSEAPTAQGGLTTVRMIQEWPTPDSFWIPWVVAQEKGFYEARGINLEVMVPPNTAATMQYLGTSQADLAFTTAVDVVTASSQGVPVVSVGRYGSANNWGLLTSGEAPIDPATLKGKTIGTYSDSWSSAQLQIMLGKAGLGIGDVNLVTADDNVVPLLLQDKVDAITGITNAEGSELTSLGTKYSITLAKDHGAPDAPVFSLAANKQWLEKNEAVAKGFMDATIEGVNYARNHPEEAVEIFLKKYPDAQTKEFSTLQWKDTAALLGTAGKDITAEDLKQTDEQWKQVADVAAKFKVITNTGEASSYYSNKALENK